ncbi:LysE family translocator [Corynebacterium alimapuense]|uniref:Threonine transporter n=1 Tax=Corynebacterium alimapuense TaxID=1576874 RepID=A0A3M8K6Q9_9CORY|nr:LysE family translocator [Corynebacterium alimapuense]RNE48198.1 threonine transporter [Corynebacterium alimapuense]
MTTAALSTLLVVWIAAIVSPGPDLVQIIRLGSRSRATGIWCALGIMLGNILWITGSLLGLSALVSAYPPVLTALQLLGGSYLFWMGTGAVRSGLKARSAASTDPEATPQDLPDLSALQAVRLGLATNLSNPKAILFFGAIFAQFIRPDMDVAWSVAVALILIVTGIAWFVGFALAVGVLASKIVRNAAVIDLITGVVFILLALVMIWEGLQGLALAISAL